MNRCHAEFCRTTWPEHVGASWRANVHPLRVRRTKHTSRHRTHEVRPGHTRHGRRARREAPSHPGCGGSKPTRHCTARERRAGGRCGACGAHPRRSDGNPIRTLSRESHARRGNAHSRPIRPARAAGAHQTVRRGPNGGRTQHGRLQATWGTRSVWNRSHCAATRHGGGRHRAAATARAPFPR